MVKVWFNEWAIYDSRKIKLKGVPRVQNPRGKEKTFGFSVSIQRLMMVPDTEHMWLWTNSDKIWTLTYRKKKKKKHSLI